MTMESNPICDMSAETPTFRTSAWAAICADVCDGKVHEAAPSMFLLERRFGPWTAAGLPLAKSGTPLTAGLLDSAELNSADLHLLDVWFKESGLSLLQVTSCTPPPADLSELSRVECIQNLEIDLEKSVDELWSDISTLPRRSMKKALAAGVRIEQINPNEIHMQRHDEISSEVFFRTGELPVNSAAQRLALAQGCLKQQLAMFSASRDGEHFGYLLSVRHGDRAYYWDVAINPSGRALGAGHLIVWRWIEWCKSQGVRRVDLVGPPEGGRAGGRPGIGRFKLSFGAEPCDYWVVYWMRHGASLALDTSRWIARLRRLRINSL